MMAHDVINNFCSRYFLYALKGCIKIVAYDVINNFRPDIFIRLKKIHKNSGS